MENKLTVQNVISINSTIEQIWDILTNPNITSRYMFGCSAISEWKEGATLNWEAVIDGEKKVFVKGLIKHINKPQRLVYSVIDANSKMEDIPRNYLNVEYLLLEVNNQIQLTVNQYGFEDAEDGMKRYDEVNNNGEGWNPILKQIKSIAEENSTFV